MDYDFPIISGMSSSQLTKSMIFQRDGEKPPTSCFLSQASMEKWENLWEISRNGGFVIYGNIFQQNGGFVLLIGNLSTVCELEAMAQSK